MTMAETILLAVFLLGFSFLEWWLAHLVFPKTIGRPRNLIFWTAAKLVVVFSTLLGFDALPAEIPAGGACINEKTVYIMPESRTSLDTKPTDNGARWLHESKQTNP